METFYHICRCGKRLACGPLTAIFNGMTRGHRCECGFEIPCCKNDRAHRG